jgi:dipeptidyl aminopeptidase/acylaminoacyl peptidase
MGDRRSMWVGKDERHGVLAQPRPDAPRAGHWRLEAIAHTPRPRSLSVGPDGRRAVFIEDGDDRSDVWLLDLDDPAAPPRRLTTGRDPVPYWDDTTPRLSPGGRTVAYVDGDHVCLVPSAGGPPRRLVEGGSPLWIDDGRLLVEVEREEDRTTRLAVIDVDDPWPRRVTTAHGELDAHGDEGDADVSPDGTLVAYTFTPRADQNRSSEIRAASIETGEVRRLTGEPDMHAGGPRWSPGGESIAYASERSGFYELHLVGADREGDRQLTSAGADHPEHAWHPDGGRLVATRVERGRYKLVSIEASDGGATELAPGGVWDAPQWTADGDIVAGYHDHATPPELRRIPSSAAPAAIHAPAPLSVKSAPFADLEDVSFESFDGLEIPAFLMRPRNASAEHPVPAVVYPHGGPTDAYADEWDGHAQYFVDMGYAWLAINFRGSTGYGREFERKNHGVWGVDDTKDCLAAADFLRTLDWVDGERLGIFGASYGSYMSLCAVTFDPEHRFRCAVPKYGDCDITTSWAQGDRTGVQDLERMMGTPAQARDAYIAGSPYHQLENVQVPLLIAHGERDERVSPKQSEQLVERLRELGKTFEYVTYPTEAHGFLRVGPQLDFYRRLERFLNWNLM